MEQIRWPGREDECIIPPEGWNCTRKSGHEGPCAAVPEMPDPKQHQIISFVKSAFRLAGYVLLPFNLFGTAVLLILAELLGIAEELV